MPRHHLIMQTKPHSPQLNITYRDNIVIPEDCRVIGTLGEFGWNLVPNSEIFPPRREEAQHTAPTQKKSSVAAKPPLFSIAMTKTKDEGDRAFLESVVLPDLQQELQLAFGPMIIYTHRKSASVKLRILVSSIRPMVYSNGSHSIALGRVTDTRKNTHFICLRCWKELARKPYVLDKYINAARHVRRVHNNKDRDGKGYRDSNNTKWR